MPAPADLLLIRHAPVAGTGHLHGRSDPDADLDPAAIAALAAALPAPARLVTSPARRCVQTAAALFPRAETVREPALREQDFGRFDGAPLADLPDLGPLAPDALAAHRWPKGESFADLCARAAPALEALAEGPAPCIAVAHAGTVRAALARAIGAPGPALAFAVAPLSVTGLSRHPGGWAVAFVNWQPA